MDINLYGVSFVRKRNKYYVKSKLTSYGLIPVSKTTYERFYNRQFSNKERTIEVKTV